MRKKEENKQENYKAFDPRRRDRMYKKGNEITLRTMGIEWKIMVQ